MVCEECWSVWFPCKCDECSWPLKNHGHDSPSCEGRAVSLMVLPVSRQQGAQRRRAVGYQQQGRDYAYLHLQCQSRLGGLCTSFSMLRLTDIAIQRIGTRAVVKFCKLSFSCVRVLDTSIKDNMINLNTLTSDHYVLPIVCTIQEPIQAKS